MNQSELARAVLTRPQSVGPLITSLLDRGLITRQGPGGRGRRSRFALTPAGRRLSARTWPRVTSARSADRLGLDADGAVTLDRPLAKIDAAVTDAPD